VGLRYEYNQHMYDVNNRLSSIGLSTPDGRFVMGRVGRRRVRAGAGANRISAAASSAIGVRGRRRRRRIMSVCLTQHNKPCGSEKDRTCDGNSIAISTDAMRQQWTANPMVPSNVVYANHH
jgi:hypothetical protein